MEDRRISVFITGAASGIGLAMGPAVWGKGLVCRNV